MDDVNIYIDEFVMDHPMGAPGSHAADTQPQLTDRLGAQVIAEIRHTVAAAVGPEPARR